MWNFENIPTEKLSFQESQKRTIEVIDRKIEDVDLSGLENIQEEMEEETGQSDGSRTVFLMVSKLCL